MHKKLEVPGFKYFEVPDPILGVLGPGSHFGVPGSHLGILGFRGPICRRPGSHFSGMPYNQA